MRNCLVIAFSVVAGGLLGACAHAPDPPHTDPRYEQLASPELSKFESARELRAYAQRVDRIGKQRARAWRKKKGDDGFITVTGSRISAPPSITNNQVAAVDEGDIVKRIGDYLVILQDGRLFAVDFRKMTLTDRVDGYRRDAEGNPAGATWYDEILVNNDRVILTAYDYERDASEISVFGLDQDNGTLTMLGTYLKSSDDYYSSSNYATRIVGDDLLVYTPLDLDSVLDKKKRPAIRRWTPADKAEGAGTPVLEATDIYRPVFAVPNPVVHTLSWCKLGEASGAALDCRSTAFTAGEDAEWYVDADHVYLVASQDDLDWWECREDEDRTRDLPLSAVFRVPHDGGRPRVLGLRGLPFDQFGMDRQGDRFRILLDRGDASCFDRDNIVERSGLADVPLTAFGPVFSVPPRDRTIHLPDVRGHDFQNRFIGNWLVIGSRENSRGHPTWHGEEPASDNLAIAVPVDRPTDARKIALDHQIRRLEWLGDDAVVTGYADQSGIHVSRIVLGEGARLSDHVKLENRYESEGRSHSFNYRVDGDGRGIMAFPTVAGAEEGDDYPWRSEPSDLEYFAYDSDGSIRSAGALEGAENFGDVEVDEEKETMTYPNGYHCEVSCTDWYGNSRAFFIEDKVFAMMGTGLVEGKVINGVMVEVRRLDLTMPLKR